MALTARLSARSSSARFEMVGADSDSAMTRRPKLWKVWTCAAERSPLRRPLISSAALRLNARTRTSSRGVRPRCGRDGRPSRR